MKKYLLLAISGLLAATFSSAQTSTVHFVGEADGNSSFTNNGVGFNIISHRGGFSIQASYPGTGWTGIANDDTYIDNSGKTNGADNALLNSSFSIKTTSNLFKVNRFWVYLGDLFAALGTVTGTLNVTGKLSGITKFTQTKTTGFATSLGTTNGYTLIDMTNLNGQNYSNIVIDELQLTLGGNYQYMGVDAFTWVKDAGLVLPVTFGAVTASTKNNQLNVSWTTEKETANDHFEIEASADGQQFKKIATVTSKATNGNSDTALNYNWTSNGSLPIAAFSLVGLALIPFSNSGRRKAWIIALTILSVGAFTIAGCSKSGDAISNNSSYYIRITQVDQDGTKTYSKVVRVEQYQ
ncbi:hypothetical protein ACLOAU_16900 [Niabella sp. CJ426]|uniref:hypothetical protein n=1 Tax=Niabella sp. CJ426 TaxID=3393740 RepID=UPI003D002F77